MVGNLSMEFDLEAPLENSNEAREPGSLMLTVKFCQPSHEFTFGVGMSFISYPLVLTPLI
jgi:hypothetical protein